MLNEARNDLSSLKVDMAELEELRDFRSDIARKEKAHAELIANQAKRLEELEGLYKEEQVLSTAHVVDVPHPGIPGIHGSAAVYGFSTTYHMRDREAMQTCWGG